MNADQFDGVIKQLRQTIQSFRLFTPEADIDGAMEELQTAAKELGRSAPLGDEWVDEHLPVIKPSTTQLTDDDFDWPVWAIFLVVSMTPCEPQMGKDQCDLLLRYTVMAHDRATWAHRAYERSHDEEQRQAAESFLRSRANLFRNWVRYCCPDDEALSEMLSYLSSPSDDHSGHSH